MDKITKTVSEVFERKGIKDCSGPPCATFTVGAALDEDTSVYSYEAFKWSCATEDDAINAAASHLSTLPDKCFLVWRKFPEIGAIEEVEPSSIELLTGATSFGADEIAVFTRPKHWGVYLRYCLVRPKDFDAAVNWQRRGTR
ncbi:MAG: hypothetical protein KGL39_04490 [Patescibacteria group bacterium]|nr:hypothetical protein [Patescibacteria group bacterium]